MRRKKAVFMDLIDLGIDVYGETNVQHNSDPNIKGIRFNVGDLSKSQIEKLNAFQNVVISVGTYKYAPEIKTYSVILLYKCLKKEEV